jgi:hypothetical protein
MPRMAASALAPHCGCCGQSCCRRCAAAGRQAARCHAPTTAAARADRHSVRLLQPASGSWPLQRQRPPGPMGVRPAAYSQQRPCRALTSTKPSAGGGCQGPGRQAAHCKGQGGRVAAVPEGGGAGDGAGARPWLCLLAAGCWLLAVAASGALGGGVAWPATWLIAWMLRIASRAGLEPSRAHPATHPPHPTPPHPTPPHPTPPQAAQADAEVAEEEAAEKEDREAFEQR